MFSRDHADPRRQISTFSKGASVPNRSNQSGGRDRSHSWNSGQPLTGVILFGSLQNDRIELIDTCGELFQFELQIYTRWCCIDRLRRQVFSLSGQPVPGRKSQLPRR